MRKPLAIKFSMYVALLTVGLSSLSLLLLYSVAKHSITKGISDRLREVGHLGTYLLDEQARQDIEVLTEQMYNQTESSIDEIAALSPGAFLQGLSSENSVELQQTPEFERLTQLLRQINRASRVEASPLQSSYPQEFSDYPDSVLPYLAVRSPFSDTPDAVQFVASFAPEAEGDDWPGNPIGTLYRPVDEIFAIALSGEIGTSTTFYRDEFYTSMSAVIPILDEQGNTIAVLGVDLLTTSESNFLHRLRWFCLFLVIASILLSIVLSTIIARRLSQPILGLAEAAQRVSQQDYSVNISVNTGDELEVLADSFQQMVNETRDYSSRLEGMVEELKHLGILKDDFLSTVSHELRTPMTAISMGVQMLKSILLAPDNKSRWEGARLEKVTRYLEMLESSCRTESQLIDNLLDLQRLEAEEFSLELSQSHLQEWLLDFGYGLEESITNQNFQLRLGISQDLPPIYTDMLALRRIVVELINNARKYTHEGGEILIAASSRQDVIEISVGNAGQTIPVEEQDQIFQKFYRVTDSDRWKFGGTGLGLALVKSLVERLGGQIKVFSQDGWTQFTVTLPTKHPLADRDSAKREKALF